MSRIEGANMAYQLAGDAALLLKLAEDADALVLVECRTRDNEPIDVAAVLGPDWLVWQDLSSPARAGTVIALRKGGPVKRQKNARSSLRKIAAAGPELQTRYLRRLRVYDETGAFTLMGAHIPKKSTGKQESALKKVGQIWRSITGRKLIFMDGNHRPMEVAHTITAPNFSGNGVMVYAWSAGFKDVAVRWVKRKFTDHLVGILTTTKEK